MGRCVLATIESDAHVWNLVFLQRLLEERGISVRNLGPCTPVAAVVAAVLDDRPDLVVISSVNGHGCYEAPALARAVREAGADVPFVIGGKLTTAEPDGADVSAALLEAGYAHVFVGDDALSRFLAVLRPAVPTYRRAA